MNIKVLSRFALLSVTSLLIVINGCNKEGEDVPLVETLDPMEIHYMKALCGGKVLDDFGFQVTSRGICFAKGKVPDIKDDVVAFGSGKGDFQGFIEELEPGTEYYFRAWATSKKGTGYGATMVVKTLPIADPDGNLYKHVKIGNQIWMKENLKTTQLNDSTPIHRATTSQHGGPFPFYYFYDFDSARYHSTYGKLYSFYAVATGKLCPKGWKVPSVLDWEELNNFLGGSQVAGGKLKEKDTVNWMHENIGATDEIGFTARPGGMYLYATLFSDIRISGNFWTSDTTSSSMYDARYQQMYYNSVVNLSLNELRPKGMSVRCLMDQ